MTSSEAEANPITFLDQCELAPDSELHPASPETLALIDWRKRQLLERLTKLEKARQCIEGRIE